MEKGVFQMSLPERKLISIDEFNRLREKDNIIYEFIDGVVYMSPSPSTKHQQVSMRLSSEIYNYLKGKTCEVFSAPFDVHLYKEGIQGEKIVIPDISVICDKTGLNEKGYDGVPELIIEILSPSNQSHDLVFKLNLYMQYGVREYWIVNPILNTIQVYELDEEGNYIQQAVKNEKGDIYSKVLNGFKISLEETFR
jgi:Uma2 family endonuclease